MLGLKTFCISNRLQILTNIDQGGLRGRKMVNIHIPLTALHGWDKRSSDCWINSSNYTINSIWLSEQQAAQMCNFGGKHQRYPAAMQYKIRQDFLR